MLSAVKISFDNIIQAAALRHSVDPALIKATIKIESNFNPMAFRHEAHIQDASWGLMQVLLKTAREVSNNPKLSATDLVKPSVNIDIGTRYIAKQLRRYKGNIKDAMAAYNAGSARRRADGSYINQGYVNKVYRWYTVYSNKGALIGLPIIIVSGAAVLAYMLSKRSGGRL